MQILLIAVIGAAITAILIGGTMLTESERYALVLDDANSQNEVYVEFYEVDSEKNRQVIVDDGSIIIEGQEFDIIDDWKGSFLNDDKLFYMAGTAENFDEKINVFLMGKFLEKTLDGSLYDVTIHIHSNKQIEFYAEGEIIGIVPKNIPKKVQTESKQEQLELLFLIENSHHRFKDQNYIFTTKLYDKKQNFAERWDFKGGEISDAQITVKVLDLDGNIWREINGLTNKFGFFEGKFPLSSFPHGEYLVLYTAKYQNTTVVSSKPLYVFDVLGDITYRHFYPISDIERGKWKDDFGNGNDLMFDDLDELLRDDSDYVRSRQLDKTKTDDILQLKLSTIRELTKDHNHIVSYTIRKDSVGGNDINFRVTLYEGTRQIAQWTHPNVDENWSLITNTLTKEQKNSITNYADLSLEFYVDCTVCDSNKREGQISWVHMFV